MTRCGNHCIVNCYVSVCVQYTLYKVVHNIICNMHKNIFFNLSNILYLKNKTHPCHSTRMLPYCKNCLKLE